VSFAAASLCIESKLLSSTSFCVYVCALQHYYHFLLHAIVPRLRLCTLNQYHCSTSSPHLTRFFSNLTRLIQLANIAVKDYATILFSVICWGAQMLNQRRNILRFWSKNSFWISIFQPNLRHDCHFSHVSIVSFDVSPHNSIMMTKQNSNELIKFLDK
jgi:hypothetical protein